MSDSSQIRLPLAGIRVLCLAIYVPGPVAAARLRELGARVTFVEPPVGDQLAHWSPSWYAALRARSRTVRLDLKQPRPRSAFERLLAAADVLLTPLRPAALDRLGLGWESLHARHPQLLHVAITGYAGRAGDVPGHDLTYQASVGLTRPPHLPATLLADLAGAERAVSAALALLLARERAHGVGRAEVALADVASDFAAPLRYGLTAPGAILGGGHPGYGFYRARDGWLAVGALEPHLWSALLTALGLAASAGQHEVEAAFLAEPVAHWEQRAATLGLPVVRADAKS